LVQTLRDCGKLVFVKVGEVLPPLRRLYSVVEESTTF
jgi:hypothetical protein